MSLIHYGNFENRMIFGCESNKKAKQRIFDSLI